MKLEDFSIKGIVHPKIKILSLFTKGGNLSVPHDSIHIDSWGQDSIKNLFTIFSNFNQSKIVHTGRQTHQYSETKTHQYIVWTQGSPDSWNSLHFQLGMCPFGKEMQITTEPLKGINTRWEEKIYFNVFSRNYIIGQLYCKWIVGIRETLLICGELKSLLNARLLYFHFRDSRVWNNMRVSN